MADVAVKRFRTPDFKGFHKIGKALGMSARMARYHANRKDDPLPVYVLDGGRHVAAFADELKAWNERRLRHYVSTTVAA